MIWRVNYIVLILFIVWILPLGAFIRADQRDKACGGQRAICLCLNLAKKAAGTGKFTTASTATNREAASPGGASHYFLNHQSESDLPARTSRYFESIARARSLLISRVIELVPKLGMVSLS